MPTAPESVLPPSGAASNPTAPAAVLATAGGGSAPTVPATVLGAAGGGSAPASPATVLAASGGGGAPAAPATVLGSAGGGSAPASPAAVLSSGGAAVGGIFGGTVTVGGTLTPALVGELLPVAVPESAAYGYQGPEWTTTGGLTPAVTGAWGKLYKWLLKTPEAATLDAIAPRGGYLATGSQSTSSQIQIWTGTTWLVYWLYDAGGGNTRWVDSADAGMADQNGMGIGMGTLMICRPMIAPHVMGDFIGGLGAGWQTDPAAVWRWNFYLYFNNSGGQGGSWYMDATDPASGTWVRGPQGTATGFPAITSSGILGSPAAVLPSYGGASAPASPFPVLP